MRITFDYLCDEKIKITNSICHSNMKIKNWSGYTRVFTRNGNEIFVGTNKEVFSFLNGLENFYLREVKKND